MATVQCSIDAPRDQVFDVLADGWLYTGWVVGASHIRAVDARWPARGAKIHHAVGAWPLMVRDETEVEVCERPSRLVLLARGRPLGEARVELRLEPDGRRTRVTMVEEPVSGPGRLLNGWLLDALIKARNVESLARLAPLAARATEPA